MLNFWQRWMQAVYGLFVLFGFIFAFFGTSSVFSPLTGPIFAAFWPAGPPTPETLRFAQFTFGIMGGLMIAIGVSGWFLARYALARGETWSWIAMVESLLLWYVVDSFMSIYTGAWVNAVLNTGFFVLAAIPLVALWPHFRGRVREGLKAPAF